eukprot:m.770165 g.770165  ORF g.770165 m.770165 type:complete len:641 (+) comp23239_c0_seq3:273-2195(+)
MEPISRKAKGMDTEEKPPVSVTSGLQMQHRVDRMCALLDRLYVQGLSMKLPVMNISSSTAVATLYHELTRNTFSWQAFGTRGTHQPQIESIVSLLIGQKFLSGTPRDVLVELGAGKALLGRIATQAANATRNGPGGTLITVELREDCATKSTYDDASTAVGTIHTPTVEKDVQHVANDTMNTTLHHTSAEPTTRMHVGVTGGGSIRQKRITADVRHVDLVAEAWAAVSEVELPIGVADAATHAGIADVSRRGKDDVTDCTAGNVGDGGDGTCISARGGTDGYEEAAKVSPNIVVLAKHFCGNATDVALQQIGLPNDTGVASAVVCPCCHSKISWDNYVGRPYLGSHGVDGKDFRLLLNMIELGRSASSSQDIMHSKWKHLKALGIVRIRKYSTLARALLEEGRRQYMLTRGWDVDMVYYVVPTVTPDNIALLVRRPRSTTPSPRDAVDTTCCQPIELIPGSMLPTHGVLLHLNTDSNDTLDTAHRVIAYVLEMASHRPGSASDDVASTSAAHGIQSAWLTYCDARTPQRPHAQSSRGCVVVAGDVSKILRWLAVDRSIQQLLASVLPYEHYTTAGSAGLLESPKWDTLWSTQCCDKQVPVHVVPRTPRPVCLMDVCGIRYVLHYSVWEIFYCTCWIPHDK